MRNRPGRRERCKRRGVLQDRSPLGGWLRGMGQRFGILAGFCERARSGRSLVRHWNVAACPPAVTSLTCPSRTRPGPWRDAWPEEPACPADGRRAGEGRGRGAGCSVPPPSAAGGSSCGCSLGHQLWGWGRARFNAFLHQYVPLPARESAWERWGRSLRARALRKSPLRSGKSCSLSAVRVLCGAGSCRQEPELCSLGSSGGRATPKSPVLPHSFVFSRHLLPDLTPDFFQADSPVAERGILIRQRRSGNWNSSLLLDRIPPRCHRCLSLLPAPRLRARHPLQGSCSGQRSRLGAPGRSISTFHGPGSKSDSVCVCVLGDSPASLQRRGTAPGCLRDRDPPRAGLLAETKHLALFVALPLLRSKSFSSSGGRRDCAPSAWL